MPKVAKIQVRCDKVCYDTCLLYRFAMIKAWYGRSLL